MSYGPRVCLHWYMGCQFLQSEILIKLNSAIKELIYRVFAILLLSTSICSIHFLSANHDEWQLMDSLKPFLNSNDMAHRKTRHDFRLRRDQLTMIKG
jgi:hypothetical protein